MDAETGCGFCGATEDVNAVRACARCVAVADARLSEVKLRLSGQVDWADVKKYGIYDRYGVPIATVLECEPHLPFSSAMMMTTSTGIPSFGSTDDPRGEKRTIRLVVKELR